MPLIKEGSDQGYLDLHNLSYGKSVESIAYLLDISLRYTQASKPYFFMNIKDCNGGQILGFMFEVSDVEAMGFESSKFKRRFVDLRYSVQVKNGFLSLHVSGFDSHSGLVDVERFLGSVEAAQGDLEKSNTNMKKILDLDYDVFPLDYSTDTLPEICEGRIGGYAQFVWAVLRGITVFNTTPGVDKVELYTVAYRVLNLYSDYLKTLSRTSVPLKFELMNLVTKYANVEDVRLRNIIQDTGLALMGLGSAEHLYAHIIVDSINKTKKFYDMSYSYKLLVDGTSRKVGNEILAKY